MKPQPEATHTPTPWELAGRNGICEVNDGKVVAEIKGFSTTDTQDEINAAFIVRAVNAHEELVQVMHELKDRLMMQQDKYGHDNREEIGWCVEALAKAGGHA